MYVLGLFCNASSPPPTPPDNHAQAASVSLRYNSRGMEGIIFHFPPLPLFHICFFPVKPQALIYPWVLGALEGKSLANKLCSQYLQNDLSQVTLCSVWCVVLHSYAARLPKPMNKFLVNLQSWSTFFFTLWFTYSYLRAAPVGEEITINAEVVKMGRTLAFTSAELLNKEGKLIAKASHTKFIGQGPPTVKSE